MLLTLTLAGTFLFFIAYYIRLRLASIQRVYLEDVKSPPRDFTFPSLSIIVAGRNEEKHIRAAVESMTALSYPALKVMAINDRSTDNTGDILDQLARTNMRLQAIHVQNLPEGWLGKINALQTGFDQLDPQVEWVLFTDADIKFAPEALQKAIFFCEANNLDHLTIFPEVEFSTRLERAFVAVFGMLISLDRPTWLIENPRSKKSLGIGAFNLIRRNCLTKIGAFRQVRLSVDDDIRLGELLKAHGFRQKAIFGSKMLSLRWQEDLKSYIRGFEKNAFGNLDYNIGKFTLAITGIFVALVLPALTLLFANSPNVALLSLGIYAVQAAILHESRRATNIGAPYILLVPVGGLLVITSMSLSAWMTLKSNGIAWRDTHYPLAALRAHVKERNTLVKKLWKNRHHKNS